MTGTQPAWLLSDFAGVLGQHQSTADRERMAATAGADFDGFWTGYWAERPEYDAASVSRETYWQRVAAGLGTNWPSELVDRLDELDVRSWLRPDDATVRLAEDARASGIRLALLSNAPLSLAAAIRRLPWLRRFDALVFSSEIRAAKPDPGSYRTALGIIGAAPGEVVFVDDREVNVRAAAELGVRSHLFTDAGELRRALLGRPGRCQ